MLHSVPVGVVSAAYSSFTVPLLMNFEDGGATTFTNSGSGGDISQDGSGITNSTDQKKFGAKSGKFVATNGNRLVVDNSGGEMEATDSLDWCLEFFVFNTDTPVTYDGEENKLTLNKYIH